MSLPIAAKPLQCRNPDCTLAAGGVCARAGHDDPLVTCPDLVRKDAASIEEFDAQGADTTAAPREPPVAPETAPPRTSAYAAPWSGRHLSETEADRLIRSSPARVVGVVGPHGAGKTCLLTSLFLLLADGKCAMLPYRFASSRSLFAFQTLGHELSQWDGHSDGQMVRHTSKSEGQERGAFLHLGLRPRDSHDNRLIDVLLCDIAGEYFEQFTSLADDTAQGRMAFLRRCDAFVLVIDGPALLNSGGRKLDALMARMLGRLVDLTPNGGVGERTPIIVAVSKMDDVPPHKFTDKPEDLLKQHAPRILSALRRARDAVSCDIFAVSAIPKSGQPQGVSELFCRVLGAVDKRASWPPIQARLPETAFPSFLAHRCWRRDP